MPIRDIALDIRSNSADQRESNDIALSLQQRIRGSVRFGHHDRMLYATDASLYQVEPIGVAIPASIDDVREIVRFCAEHGLPLLPRGGGTSLAGQTVNRAVIIDFSVHCRNIVDLDVEGKRARVEPGMVPDHLNAALAKHDLMFGPDVATAAYANIGGMIGNNSAGAHSILYGRTVEHVLAMNVMLADGRDFALYEGAAEDNAELHQLTQRVADVVLPLADEIRDKYPQTMRRVDGYNLEMLLDQFEQSTPETFNRVNLAHLFCGSEGTLGVTLDATLNLVDRPKCKGMVVLSYPDVQSALGDLTTILTTGPAAVELIDDVVLDAAVRNKEYRRDVKLLPQLNGQPPGAVLYVEYFGSDEEQLRESFRKVCEIAATDTWTQYLDAAAMTRAWALRKAGEPLLYATPGVRKPITFIEDTAVDPRRLPDFIREFRELVARHGTRAAYYAHASVGCLHIRPMINLRDASDREMMQRLAEDVTDLVKQYDGALSGEHGDGRVRSPLLERFYGADICRAFAAIKSIFDPQNRMNPGNITAPEGMLTHLRARPNNHDLMVPDTDTFFRYEREGGFGRAIEQCNGAGVCRRMQSGTMCPSYRALLDERHATRGRGNALRLAITGQFSPTDEPNWRDADTRETLDLCLSCKACKTECPSNVDITKLKSEYTAQGYRDGSPMPLSARMLVHIRTLNRLGSRFHRIANAVAGSDFVRSMMQRQAGIDRRRRLPVFEPSLFRWYRKHRKRLTARANSPTLIVFADCFTAYNEPRVGIATIKALDALGYNVALPDVGCCGRPAMSAGALKAAQKMCPSTIRRLHRAIDRHRAQAIAFLEPSCLSAVKDEWGELKMNTAREDVEAIMDRSWLAEEFIANRWDDHPTQPRVIPDSDNTPVVLHGHCHQKALFGIDSSADMLRRAFGERLHTLDTGCCGMAGFFGYTTGHFDLSLKVGETSLFPQLRQWYELDPNIRIAAPGTSCRHQIRDGLGLEAQHPMELLADAICRD